MTKHFTLAIALLTGLGGGCAATRMSEDDAADATASPGARPAAAESPHAAAAMMTAQPVADQAAPTLSARSAAPAPADAAPQLLDAGTSRETDAAVEVQCPRRDIDAGAVGFDSSDPAFGSAFWVAKLRCDGEHGWTCNFIFVRVDDAGCVTGVDLSMGNRAGLDGSAYETCLSAALRASCSRCEANEQRRFFESCTLL
jgi:hypothetical protein